MLLVVYVYFYLMLWYIIKKQTFPGKQFQPFTNFFSRCAVAFLHHKWNGMELFSTKSQCISNLLNDSSVMILENKEFFGKSRNYL